MFEDVKCDYERDRETSQFKDMCLGESEICDKWTKQNEVTESHNHGNNSTEFQGQELADFMKTLPQNLSCDSFRNSNLPPRWRPSLESAFEKHTDENATKYDTCAESSNTVEISGDVSFLAEPTNGIFQQGEAMKITDKRGYSQIHGPLKNHSSKDRKSSLRNVTILPPLVEEKFDRSPRTSPSLSTNPNLTNRQTTDDIRERKHFEIPSIVLPQAEYEDKDTHQLRLPKIEAASTIARYHKVSPSPPEPNRLVPPLLLEPYKAHRPTVQPSREGTSDRSVAVVRLPELKTRSSRDRNERDF